MPISLPISIIMAVAVNLLVCVFFLYLFQTQQKAKSYLLWGVSCGLFALGILVSVVATDFPLNKAINTSSCLLLFSAAFLLYRGLYEFELTPGGERLYRKTQYIYGLGLLVIVIAGFFHMLANVAASMGMAVMLLLAEGFFYQRLSQFRQAYLSLRVLLLVHAFVLFLQGVLLLAKLVSGPDSSTNRLFDVVLITHLLLTVATALLLPVLHLLRQRQHWEKLANEDDLTGLLSRRAFLNQSLAAIEDLKNSASTLFIVDIDHFKRINDQYGHACGDLILKRVAVQIKSCLRDSDVVGRVGGEEFAVLLPRVAMERANVVAERLRESIAKMKTHYKDDTVEVTVSIGIAVTTELLYDWEVLYEKADKALYNAKNNGRNLVYLYH